MTKRIILAAAAAFAFAGCEPDNQATVGNNAAAIGNEALPGGGAARPVGAAELRIASKDPFGDYLVDGAGRALYVLEGSREQGGQQAQQLGQKPECTGECLAEWPPYLTEGAPRAGPGVQAGQISTASFQQGQQVTYAGWPLYYYRGDRDDGSTAGQDVHDRWGGWYLLSPQGERIEGRQLGPAAE